MQRTAIITGASVGIGLEIARLFAADKWDVALVARTEPKLRELAAQFEKEHGITAHSDDHPTANDPGSEPPYRGFEARDR
ncbi:MAG TPA: SDR family NAD(P)-dependent oxidoreductase [Thermoanaerobaculia bacterium]|jgi:short-subunit dehydrogenase|nr:SDR family NAD(P)-dependent oxidoreductase [Thermoanaerobaculia bacterium]